MIPADNIPAPPLHRFYDLNDLSEAGDEIVIAAKADDLPRLARWLDVDAVEGFAATVKLRRLGPNRFAYDALLDARIVQSCVVSLKPVHSHLQPHISRILDVCGYGRRRREVEANTGEALMQVAAEGEAPEEIESAHYDLAVPLLEEASLAIDLYPRAEGVEFTAPVEGSTTEESPFAVLKRLKKGGS